MSLAVAIALTEALLHVMDRREEISAEMLVRGERIDLKAMNYNSEGVLRSKPSANVFRALSFGDSFAYTIVKPDLTYHSIAASVASAQSGRPVEIVNLGEPAISFYQYMNAYRVFGPAIEHDAVIFNIYLGNDLLDVAYRYVPDDVGVNRLFGKLSFDLQTGETRKVAIPRKFALRAIDYAYAIYLSWTGKIKPAQKQAPSSQYNFAVAELAEDAWLHHIDTQLDNFDPKKFTGLRDGYVAAVQFARRVREIADSGKKVLVLLSPNQSQVDPDVLNKVLTRYGHARNLDLDFSARLITRIFKTVAPSATVLYLRPMLSCARGKGVASYYKTDTHWSAEGNRVVGEAVGGWVASHWLDATRRRPAECALDEQQRFSDTDPIFETQVSPLLVSAPREGRLK